MSVTNALVGFFYMTFAVEPCALQLFVGLLISHMFIMTELFLCRDDDYANDECLMFPYFENISNVSFLYLVTFIFTAAYALRRRNTYLLPFYAVCLVYFTVSSIVTFNMVKSGGRLSKNDYSDLFFLYEY